MSQARACAWCQAPLPPSMSPRAIYCTSRCRNAAWRASSHHRHSQEQMDQSLRLAITTLDPSTDLQAQIRRLDTRYRGWALLATMPLLPQVLRAAPAHARTAAWLHPTPQTGHRTPVNAWQPIIYRPARTPAAARILGGTPGPILDVCPDPDPTIALQWIRGLLGAIPTDHITRQP